MSKNWNQTTKGKVVVKNNYTSASGNSSGSASTTPNSTNTGSTQGGTTTSGGKNTTTSSPTLSRYNATRDYIYVSGAAMKWEAKLADGTVRVKAKRSSVPSGNKKAIESYWNSERNFQGTWWTHEGTLLDSYDTLIQEARDNGGSLDMNEVMMNPNKMIVLQAMMMVFPKSGYYDEAMEAKLNLIGVRSGWHYDAGTGKLSLGMLNDISEYYDSIDDVIKKAGVVYDNGGAEMLAGAMAWGMGITATVAANAAGKNSNSNTDRGGSTQNEEGTSSEGGTNSSNSSDLGFGSTTKSTQKLMNQMNSRGWTEDLIKNTVDNPYTIRTSVNKATGNTATVFYTQQGSYVIVDDITKAIVQICDNINPSTWAPDLSIVDPYLPK